MTLERHQIGEYWLLEVLGLGSMGTVYKALSPERRMVAVKVLAEHLASDPEYRGRFQREATAMMLCCHPHLVRIYSYHEEGTSSFIVMELLSGFTVQHHLSEFGPLSETRALQISRQIADALIALQERGVVHRDIKPANIFFDRKNAVRLGDFGLARREGMERTLTAPQITVGTALYMSPEQIRAAKGLDARSDLYSLGATLYHMLTGEPPFLGQTPLEVVQRHLTEKARDPRDLNAGISEACAKLVLRLLAKKRHERFRSPAELCGTIDFLLEG